MSGNDRAGAAFEARWSFTSGTSTVENELGGVVPADGAQVGSEFTVRGRILPRALVVVQVGAVAGGSSTIAGTVGSILGLGGANVRNEVTANAGGSFTSVIAINAPPRGRRFKIFVNSTDLRTKSAAHPIARTSTVR